MTSVLWQQGHPVDYILLQLFPEGHIFFAPPSKALLLHCIGSSTTIAVIFSSPLSNSLLLSLYTFGGCIDLHEMLEKCSDGHGEKKMLPGFLHNSINTISLSPSVIHQRNRKLSSWWGQMCMLYIYQHWHFLHHSTLSRIPYQNILTIKKENVI